MKLKFLWAPTLLVAMVLGMNTTHAQQKNNNDSKEMRGSLNVTTIKSDGSGETNVNYVEDGHRYKMRLNGSKIVELYVDDKKVPEDEYGKYDKTVKRILEQLEKDRKQAEKDRAQAVKDREQADRDRAQAEKDRQQAIKDREQAEKDRDQAMRDREQADKDRAQAEQDRAQAEKDREQAVIDRKKAEEDRKLLNAMIDEIVKDKLVENRASLTSLEFDNSKMVINGKEQPENIHSRYKQKYLKGENNRIQFRNSGNGRTISFD